jgi:PTS system mannose-specific IIA component
MVTMVGILVVSHGRLTEALIAAAQSLVGSLQKVTWISIWPKDKEKEVKDRIQRGITEVDDGDGVVILTDALGGTPTNLSLSIFEDKEVEVVTGVNLPMLLTLSSYRKGKSIKELGQLLKRSGRRSITLAKEVLGSKRGDVR